MSIESARKPSSTIIIAAVITITEPRSWRWRRIVVRLRGIRSKGVMLHVKPKICYQASRMTYHLTGGLSDFAFADGCGLTVADSGNLTVCSGGAADEVGFAAG